MEKTEEFREEESEKMRYKIKNRPRQKKDNLKWHIWFAWYPVKARTLVAGQYYWACFEYVYRRKIEVSTLSAWDYTLNTSRDTFILLKRREK